MPVFATPEPVTVVVTLQAADVSVVASDRADTVVTGLAADGGSDDPAAADIALAGGRLTVTAPTRARSRRGPWLLDLVDRLRGPTGQVVTIEVPTGSHLQVESSYGSVHADGTLGTCRIRLGYGDVRLDRTGSVEVRSRHGDVVVDHVEGHAEITVSSGDVSVRSVDGTATIDNNHSDIDIGEITGALRLSGAHGEMVVGRAGSDVHARTSYGSVRIGETESGVVDLSSTHGELDVGVAAGTAAWLEISSSTGSVRNLLTTRTGPDGFDRTVEVRARSRDGDVVVRRA